MLTEVFAIDECLKTYYLKTSAIVCHLGNPVQSRALSVEEWALLIFKQLELRLKHGNMMTIFGKTEDKPDALFRCLDSIDTEPCEQRQCCEQRRNLLIIVTYLRCLLVEYLKVKKRDIRLEDINIMAKNACDLKSRKNLFFDL